MILDKIIDNVYGVEFDLEDEASSMILRIGWTKTPKTKDNNMVGTLKIVFKTVDHVSYYYDKVPFQTFQELMTSESYGIYLNKHIKNKYKFIKIIPTEGKEDNEPRTS